MEKTELLTKINEVLDNIDLQTKIEIARQEGFNQGYKTCLQEMKSLLESENKQEVKGE